MNFEELKLAPAIVKAVREQGYETPTAIQAQAIPLVLEGHDLLGGAQTGTGKTAAFTLPLLHRLSMSRSAENKFGGTGIRALVLTPTRELAAQVEESVRVYGKHLQLKSTAIFGGVGKIDVVELPYPECGDDEAIVRNLMTGVCGSDIFAFHKHGPESRIWIGEEFGHESISEVVELGRNVKGLKLGDRVFVNQDKAFRDMRRVSATEAGQVKPRRLSVVTVARGDTVQSLAARMAYSDAPLERFLVLNGLASSAVLRLGDKVKLVTY